MTTRQVRVTLPRKRTDRLPKRGILLSDVVDEQNDRVRKVREFLYVDLQRIRSYYAQLNRGVVESVINRDTNSKEGETQARILGFGGTGGISREREREEARSLQDLNYVIFEELFEKEGLIKDVDELVDDVDSWASSRVHESLNEGDVIRYTGFVQILDPEFTKRRIEQIIRFGSAIMGAQVGPQAASSSEPPVRKGGNTKPGRPGKSADEVRTALKEQMLQAAFGDIAISQINDIADAVGAFTNETISVRVLPFGAEHLDYHFAGTLLSRSEYIQDEREALFARYGYLLQDWTVVMQIARIPGQDEVTPEIGGTEMVRDGVVDRPAFENQVLNLVRLFESLGFAEGSSFPAISVTILAIYREFA
jgi:hypothetical protein